MITSSSPASRWAGAFLLEAYRLGVDDVVISPGSRSQALALAAYDLSVQPGSELRVHVAVDERTAGFLGLGLSAHSVRPTILISTSGSAPGHYLPAILEAKHSGVPLIVVSADRPAELRGVGANQTTKQPGMFGEAVCWSVDVPAPEDDTDLENQATSVASLAVGNALSGAVRNRPGAVHLNVAFREPLSSPISWGNAPSSGKRVEEPLTKDSSNKETLTIHPEPGTLVIAGHQAGGVAEQLAHDLGAPLIAEVHSGAHFGPHLVVAYRTLVGKPELAESIRRVVTVGRPTLSREVQQLLQTTDIEQIVWQRRESEPSNPSHQATVVDELVVEGSANHPEIRQWLSLWVSASREIVEEESARFDPPAPNVALASSENMAERSRFAKQEMDVFRAPLSRRAIAKAVWDATWPHDHLVLASSRMIRELDRVAPGKNIPVWSNRGLSGIDGTIATARGIALSRGRAGATGVTRVLLGDLSFAHDVGSLLLDQGERESTSIQLVVVRDGGGSLFDLLEVAHSADPSAYQRVVFAPVELNTRLLAEAYGWEYRHVQTAGDLSEALVWNLGHSIVECTIER